jgi:hypothetical protein
MANLVLEKEGLHSSLSRILRLPRVARDGVQTATPSATASSPSSRATRWRPLHAPAARLQRHGARRDSGVSTTKLKRNEALADFYLEYGLPGKRGYSYDRPFDYFAFQATLSSANAFENVMTRGLLKGRSYQDGDTLRGVFGLYGLFDYIFPQTFRVSSTAVSLGTTAQWQMSKNWILQGTALGGVGYTGVGSTNSTTDGDYHYGLAPQALAAGRLIYKDRAALDVTAREYFVTKIGAASRGGHENIVRVDAALTWRVVGQHGISIKYLGNFRDAFYPDTGDSSQHRGTIGLFYTLLGNERFGAVSWRDAAKP